MRTNLTGTAIGLADSTPQGRSSIDIAVLRLESQILNFQSQLKLAQAEIQLKDATIEAKDEVIELLRLGQVFAAAETGSVKQPEEEDKSFNIAGKYLRAKKYEGKGFEVNIPALLHDLKRLMVEEDPKPESKALKSPSALPEHKSD